jgi:hypothetical protein
MMTLKTCLRRFVQWSGYTDLKFSFLIVLVWRILIEVYAIFVLNRFPLTDTISHKFYFLTIWYNYDGHHFVGIAQHGYQIIQYAFFPLFPLAIKLLSWPVTLLIGDKLSIYLVAGLIITTLSLVGTIYFMLQIARIKFDVDTGKRAVILLLFFPSAIFLGAIYSESFFLLWATASFYFMLQRRWAMASIMAAAAAATRSTGAVLFMCLAIDFWLAYKDEWRNHWRSALWFLLVPFSIIVYMIYQWVAVGNPMQFMDAQKAWGRQMTIMAPYTDLKDLVYGLNLLRFNANTIAPLYDGLAVLFGLATAAVLLYKRWWSMAVYAFVCVALPLASGVTYSSIRFVLIIFPAFLLLGHWGKRPMVYSFMVAFLAIFFAILSIHYLNTWWLA